MKTDHARNISFEALDDLLLLPAARLLVLIDPGVSQRGSHLLQLCLQLGGSPAALSHVSLDNNLT